MLETISNQYSTQEKEETIVRYLENYKVEIEGERALWQSVIMQAVLDLQIKANTIKRKMDRAETLKWFSKEDQDFMFVCQMAGFNPDMIIKGAKQLYKKHNKSLKQKIIKKTSSQKLTNNQKIKTKTKITKRKNMNNVVSLRAARSA